MPPFCWKATSREFALGSYSMVLKLRGGSGGCCASAPDEKPARTVRANICKNQARQLAGRLTQGAGQTHDVAEEFPRRVVTDSFAPQGLRRILPCRALVSVILESELGQEEEDV